MFSAGSFGLSSKQNSQGLHPIVLRHRKDTGFTYFSSALSTELCSSHTMQLKRHVYKFTTRCVEKCCEPRLAIFCQEVGVEGTKEGIIDIGKYIEVNFFFFTTLFPVLDAVDIMSSMRT